MTTWAALNHEISELLRSERERRMLEAQRREAEAAAAITQQLAALQARLVAEWPADIITATAAVPQADEAGHALVALQVDNETWTAHLWGRDWRITAPMGEDLITSSADIRPTFLRAVGNYRAWRSEKELNDARVAVALEEARRKLWTWPMGMSVEVYRWTWCKAPGTSEAGAEYGTGWSLQHRLDPGGWLNLQPLKASSWERPGRVRRLCLCPESLPVVEAHSFASVASLPSELRERVCIQVVGDEERDEDGHPGLLPEVGEVPLPWIRSLLIGESPCL
jgi:hypothetical protein